MCNLQYRVLRKCTQIVSINQSVINTKIPDAKRKYFGLEYTSLIMGAPFRS